MAKAPENPSPERHPVLTFLTPNQDLLFWEKVDMKIQRNRDAVYGQAHWDTVRYPHHELVFIKPLDSGGQWYQFYYAAKRENQDDYNYEIIAGEELIRTYVIPRDKYFARPENFATPVEDEFLYPVAGTASPDSVFEAYCFADDTLRRADDIIDSSFVIIQRRFVEPVTEEFVYNESLMRNVKVTKTVIPAKSFVSPEPVAGKTVEVKKGNFFHDIKIEQEIELVTLEGGAKETYPYSLPTLPATYNKQFPSKLDSIELVWAWALAENSESAHSYSEDYYFKFMITDARPGPYSATIYRYITNNPDALKASNPITHIPQPVSESIAVVGAWAVATPKGNSSSATAKEWNIPPTIHPEVTISTAGEASPPSTFFMTNSVEATPGFSTFAGLTVCTVDFDVKQAPFGLFEVSVVKIDITNLYSDVYSGGSGGVTIVTAPTNVTATAISPTQVNVSWDLVPGATKYLVYRSTNGVSYAYVAEIADPQDIHMDYGRTTGTTYYYRVRAAYLGFQSGYSNTASATTP